MRWEKLWSRWGRKNPQEQVAAASPQNAVIILLLENRSHRDMIPIAIIEFDSHPSAVLVER